MSTSNIQPTPNPVARARRVNASPGEGPDLVTETVWFNPTDQVVRLELYVGVKQNWNLKALGRRLTHEERTGLQIYEIGPGERVSLSKEFDRAIHDVRGGVICGGLGPQLHKEGEQYVLHPVLDEQLARMKAAAQEASEALARKTVHEQAMVIATLEADKAQQEIARRGSSSPSAPNPPHTPKGGKSGQ